MKTACQPVNSNEWHQQWSLFRDEESFLFKDWIYPAKLEDFRDKTVLECGCGGGQHTSFIAPLASFVTAVDLNTIDIAKSRNKQYNNIDFIHADIATMNLGKQFDIVLCIGVIHHTYDPDKTFESLYKHCKSSGKIIIWTYSAEGNELVRFIVEPMRKLFLRRLSRKKLAFLSKIVTTLLYPFVYTIYFLNLFKFLPYFEYFQNFRKMSFERNVLNVFDKLNAPRTHFITLDKCKEWFNDCLFEPTSIFINKYAGVSYRLNGIKK